MNPNQMDEKKRRIIKTVKTFIMNPHATMEQLADLTGFPKSSVQRYLNDDSMIPELFGYTVFKFIRDQVNTNKINGCKTGGLHYAQNNLAIKNTQGQFQGNDRRTEARKNIKEMIRILEIANLFLEHPTYTLDDVAHDYNQTHSNQMITKDYVYRVLTSKKGYYALTERLYSEIELQLVYRKLNGNAKGAIIHNQNRGIK